LITLQGIYVIVIKVNKDTNIDIGALGNLPFKKGLYAYVGSAQKNLQKRIQRHLRKQKRIFWHIDYLLDNPASKPVKTFFKQASKTEECAIAREMSARNEAIIGFGCSDCNCKSHLFRIKNTRVLQQNMKTLNINIMKE
jgi:Uri superfamily endonuclease